jgi:hypothetical protein
VLLALDVVRLERAGSDGVPDERVRRRAHQDLAGPRGLLEARGDVHRVARRERPGPADHDLARVDPDLNAERHAEVTLQLGIERLDAIPYLGRRAHRAERVVLVRRRDAEHRDDRVADELLHRGAVALEDRGQLGEVALHQDAQRLGIELVCDRDRVVDVAEENGHDLARLDRTHGCLGMRLDRGYRGGARGGGEGRVVRKDAPLKLA